MIYRLHNERSEWYIYSELGPNDVQEHIVDYKAVYPTLYNAGGFVNWLKGQDDPDARFAEKPEEADADFWF